jgi:hypothetical protein
MGIKFIVATFYSVGSQGEWTFCTAFLEVLAWGVDKSTFHCRDLIHGTATTLEKRFVGKMLQVQTVVIIAGSVSNTDWSWSTLFADYDNDGLQDLFVSK